MIDVVALYLGNQASLLTSRLAVAGPHGQPVIPFLMDATHFAVMKNQAGWPADINTFDDTMIRQWVTETQTSAATYSNPAYYRKFVTPIPWMPRFFNPGDPAWVAVTPISSYFEVQNGLQKPLQNVGLVVVTFAGPFNDMDFGGIVGKEPYYLHSYYYNPGLATRERNYLVEGAGQVQWDMSELSGNQYGTPVKTSLFNTSVPGPMPKLAWKP